MTGKINEKLKIKINFNLLNLKYNSNTIIRAAAEVIVKNCGWTMKANPKNKPAKPILKNAATDFGIDQAL